MFFIIKFYFFTTKKSKKNWKIKTLYITPLRALNRDVFRRITKYAHENELSETWT